MTKHLLGGFLELVGRTGQVINRDVPGHVTATATAAAVAYTEHCDAYEEGLAKFG